MTSVELRCEGLEPDKLVAFLALLGTLRALRVARPAWRVHARWMGDDPRPVIEVAGAEDEGSVGVALVEGVRAHREAFVFNGREMVKFKPGELRELLRDALAISGEEGRLRLDAVSVLGSDVVVDQKGFIHPTPYCVMDRGQQKFLKNWSLAPEIDVNAADRVLAALRRLWPYGEEGLKFRWDPEEDRRYALRAGAPTNDKVKTCDAANRLAAIGLASLPASPTERVVEAPGFVRRGRQREFRWPIWTVPLRERAIVTLLRHPHVLHGYGRAPAGVTGVMVAERRSVGDYLVVTPARRIGAGVTYAPLTDGEG
jgi:hypothetical protein